MATATFRYRVFGNSSIHAGCANLETALEIARFLSERMNFGIVVFDHPHGSGRYGSVPVARFLNGKEDEHDPTEADHSPDQRPARGSGQAAE
jgi:hypothetical protein